MTDANQTWDLFTLKREYELGQKRSNGYQLFDKSYDISEPIVSKQLYSSGFRPSYPEEKKFAVCLSHDIDTLFYNVSPIKFADHLLRDVVKSRWPESKRRTKSYFKKKKFAYENIESILNVEQKYKAKSTFFFLSLLEKEPDYNYSLEQITDIFNLIDDNGCEIGLHGGHEAFDSIDKMALEKKQLEQSIGKSVTGYRNHYLKFDIPSSWDFLAKNKFKYDTTLGYPNALGFRNGMCYPFQPYNREQGCFSDILEIPMIIMDVTLWRYMNLNLSQAFDHCKALIDCVAKLNGVITLNWHNVYFYDEQKSLYEAILKYCNQENAWLTSCDSLASWWLEKKYVQNYFTPEQLNNH